MKHKKNKAEESFKHSISGFLPVTMPSCSNLEERYLAKSNNGTAPPFSLVLHALTSELIFKMELFLSMIKYFPFP